MRLRAVSVAIALLCLGTTPGGALAAQRCAVTGLEGSDARLQLDGARQALARGAFPGDARLIETGAGTRLELTCEDGTVVTIGPESRVDLGQLLTQPEQSVFMQLFTGIIGLVTPPRPDAITAVQTPVAIASVRSTKWLVEHKEATAVFVREGSVAVSNDSAEIVLEAGEGVTVSRGEVVKPVARWGPERLRQVGAALGFGWE